MRHLAMIGAATVGLMMGAPMFFDTQPTFAPSTASKKGHSWSGKRRKLKKYAQDHQRPHRRRV